MSIRVVKLKYRPAASALKRTAELNRCLARSGDLSINLKSIAVTSGSLSRNNRVSYKICSVNSGSITTAIDARSLSYRVASKR